MVSSSLRARDPCGAFSNAFRTALSRIIRGADCRGVVVPAYVQATVAEEHWRWIGRLTLAVAFTAVWLLDSSMRHD